MVIDYDILIHGYKLILTCHGCPEQYDVYDQTGNQVAYLRLRHSKFTVVCPDVGGELVYSVVNTIGDGVFNDSERIFHLNEAVLNVQKWIINSKFSSIHDYE